MPPLAPRALAPLALAAACALACSDPDPLTTSDGRAGDGAPADAGVPDRAPTPDTAPDAWVPAKAPSVKMPRTSILPSELGVLYNEKDPISVAVAKYYQLKRGIPQKNMVKLSFSPHLDRMEISVFKPLKAKVDAALGKEVQALALTWRWPYRVHCMSVTSAFALGYEAKYCNDIKVSGKWCGTTAPVSYFKSESSRPFTDHKLRPTMALAGMTEADVKKVIDRGLAAEGTMPPGKGYLVRTTDKARSVRYGQFQVSVAQLNHKGGVALEYIDNSKGTAAGNHISGKADVMFYFTGLKTVDKLTTNTYRPGAVGDHLTSFGGKLRAVGKTGQMSVLRWLEAGLTGSYGTTMEPCNYPHKFPDTRIMLPYYFRGATLVEAYWKSVNWPGEGIFIGDPLARPWGTKVSWDATKRSLTIRTSILKPTAAYQLWGVSPATGKEELVRDKIKIPKYLVTDIVVAPVKHSAYRLALTP